MVALLERLDQVQVHIIHDLDDPNFLLVVLLDDKSERKRKEQNRNISE